MIADNHSDKINAFIPPRLQYQKSEIQKNHQGWIDFQKQQNKKVDVQVLSKNVSVFSFDRTTNFINLVSRFSNSNVVDT